MGDNCLSRETLEITISGTSTNSKEDAVNQAFRSLQEEVRKDKKGIIISIRPLAVSLKELEIKEYTERFLFIFMPRKKQKVKVILLIQVEIDILDIEKGAML